LRYFPAVNVIVKSGVWFLLAEVAGWSVPVHALESPIVESIQGIPVSSLESGAPALPLSTWLTQLGGASLAKLEWEVNDCGEGGDGRVAPTCVEGRIVFNSRTSAGVSVAVDTTQGRTGGKPSIFMMYLKDAGKVTFARSLRELESVAGRFRH